jgi:hypothetical protein
VYDLLLHEHIQGRHRIQRGSKGNLEVRISGYLSRGWRNSEIRETQREKLKERNSKRETQREKLKIMKKKREKKIIKG